MESIIGVDRLILRKFSKTSVFKVRATIFYFFLTIFFVVFNPAHSIAEDFYVAQSAAGSNNGSSCANAFVATWLNSAANWAVPKESGKVGPGDTAHLCGTISTAFDLPGGGSADGVVTILFEPGAKMSAPTWGATGAIRAYGKHYLTIDGGATGIIGGFNGNPSLVNGIIECTDNGTGLGNQVHTYGVLGVTASYFTVKNLLVRNIYVRTAGTEQLAYGVGIADTASNGAITGFTVYNNIVHDAYIGINSDYSPGSSDYEISYNTSYNCNWSACAGGRGGATDSLTGLSVHDNYFHSWTNWDETGSNAFHHNGFYTWCLATSGSVTAPEIYNNVIGPGFGGSYQTGGIFAYGYLYNTLIYNNVFIVDSGESVGNGMITTDSYYDTTINVYNNTFISEGGSSGVAIKLTGGSVEATQTINVKNNLVTGSFVAIALHYNANITLNSDYNSFYGLPTSGFIYSSTASGVFKTLAEWQALTFDANSVTTDPKVTSTTDGRLQSDSPNRDFGTSLSGYFTIDADNFGRPAGSGWDIGAYEYGIAAPLNFGRIIK